MSKLLDMTAFSLKHLPEDELTKLGQQALRNPPPVVIADWLAEEATELATASTTEEELDALFDAWGIIMMALAFYGPSEIRKGFAHYTQAQVTRGRPIAFWNGLIKHLAGTYTHVQREGRMHQSMYVYLKRLANHGRGFAKARALAEAAVKAYESK